MLPSCGPQRSRRTTSGCRPVVHPVSGTAAAAGGVSRAAYLPHAGSASNAEGYRFKDGKDGAPPARRASPIRALAVAATDNGVCPRNWRPASGCVAFKYVASLGFAARRVDLVLESSLSDRCAFRFSLDRSDHLLARASGSTAAHPCWGVADSSRSLTRAKRASFTGVAISRPAPRRAT